MKQFRIIKTAKNKKLRVNVIMTVLIIVAVTAGFQNGLKEVRFLRLTDGKDDITVFENNFEGIRRILPPFSKIGYYSDKKYDARTFSLTRYTLSPRIIVQDLERPFVIGNFSRLLNPAEFAKAHNLSIIQKVDQNMVLFKRGSE